MNWTKATTGMPEHSQPSAVLPSYLVYNTTGSSTDGFFSVQVNPISVGHVGEFKVTTESGGVATAKRVLVGDVLLCSGQSNMELPLNYVFNGTEEIAAAGERTSYIRLFEVYRNTSVEPLQNVSGAWVPATPTTVANFSAVCYLSARHLADMHTGTRPLGLIWAAVGGTPIEAWMSKAMLEDPCPFGEQSEGRENEARSSAEPVHGQVAPIGASTSIGVGRPDPTSNSVLYNAMIYPIMKKALRGVLWF